MSPLLSEQWREVGVSLGEEDGSEGWKLIIYDFKIDIYSISVLYSICLHSRLDISGVTVLSSILN